MAREHETASAAAAEQQQQQPPSPPPPWGTFEELLLACAVNRHGTKRWESIAMEVQNRSSKLSSLTPQNCRDKFNDLKRRFVSQNGTESTSLVPLVDQLRQIRVQELRDEVQRRDVTIVSLESEVKRLEEERERSVKAAESDLERDGKSSAEEIIIAAVDGENSDDHENRSFNESNSTTQKAETKTRNKQNDAAIEGVKPEPEGQNDPVVPVRVRPDKNEPDRERERERDWSSNNGKFNGNVKVKGSDGNGNGNGNGNDKTTSERNNNMKKSIKKNKTSGGEREPSESNELWDESSKREGKEVGLASKHSSDVQSSASLSKEKRRRTDGKSGGGGAAAAAAGCSSGEEPEVSPATKKVLAVKSEPLVRLLGMIRSHRLGSYFERRLRSQESERYKNLVRQHIVLSTIQSRLDKGVYTSYREKFYRDLLLLFNNFIIYFRRSSQEYAAAHELRALVIKDMKDKLRKRQTLTIKPKPEQQQQKQKQPVSLSKQPNRASSSMVVCGKQRSSSVKGGVVSHENVTTSRKSDHHKKERERVVDVEEKPKGVITDRDQEKKKIDSNSFVGGGGVEEKSGGIKKKIRSKERSVSSSTSRRNSKTSKEIDHHEYGGNELSSHDPLEVKTEKKDINVKKKLQGAASFLKRINKQNSPSSKRVEKDDVDVDGDDDDDVDNDNDEEEDDDDDDDDVSEDGSKDSKVEEDKKRNRGRKRDSGRRRDRVTRSSRGRGVREENGKVKRGVGRPPKKSPAATSPPDSTSGKRGRERDNGGESEFGVGSAGRPRKRSRR